MKNKLTDYCRRCVGYGTFTRLDSKTGIEFAQICDCEIGESIRTVKDSDGSISHAPETADQGA